VNKKYSKQNFCHNANWYISKAMPWRFKINFSHLLLFKNKLLTQVSVLDYIQQITQLTITCQWVQTFGDVNLRQWIRLHESAHSCRWIQQATGCSKYSRHIL